MSDGYKALECAINMDTNKIINLADPTGAQDAVTKAYVDAKDSFPGGVVYVGVDDTQSGTVHLYGHATGSSQGGEIRFYNAADHDSIYSYYVIRAYGSDWDFMAGGGITLKLQDSPATWICYWPWTMNAGKDILFAGASCDVGSTGQLGDNAYFSNFHVTDAGTEYVTSSGAGILTVNAATSVDVVATLKVDTIAEYTGAAGVTIDSVLLKDNEVTADGATFTGGWIDVGADDSQAGEIYLYGSAPAGGTNGGQVLFYTAGDYDTTINYYRTIASEDDFLIQKWASGLVTLLSYRGATTDWLFDATVNMAAGLDILAAGASSDIGSTGQMFDNTFSTKFLVTTAGTEYATSGAAGMYDIHADGNVRLYAALYCEDSVADWIFELKNTGWHGGILLESTAATRDAYIRMVCKTLGDAGGYWQLKTDEATGQQFELFHYTGAATKTAFVATTAGVFTIGTEAEIGQWPVVASFAYFGNADLDHSVAGNYALMQENDGDTYLNAASGKQVYHRIANATVFETAAAGITIANTKDILFATDAGTDIGSGNAAANIVYSDSYHLGTSANEYISVTGTDIQVVAAGNLDLHPTGITTIGDGGTTDYAEFEADGTLVFHGAATVWGDANLGAARLSKPVSSAPDTDEFKDTDGTDIGVDTYAFAPGEKVSGDLEMPHDYKEGSDFTFHVHWQGIAAPTGTDKVKWQLIYSFGVQGANPAAVTTIVVETDFDTQYDFMLSSFPAISDGAVNIEDQFLFQLSRVTATADEYGGDALIATVGIHYEKDTVGSRQILTK